MDVVLYRQHELNSYRNVTKQFNLVSQTLKELCPSKLLNRSLGRALGFYMLVGLRAKDAGGVLTLFRQCSWSVRIFSMWYAAKICPGQTAEILIWAQVIFLKCFSVISICS